MSASEIIISFLLLPQQSYRPLDVAWTLSYEILFYSAFALAILTSKRIGLFLLFLWCFGFVVYQVILQKHAGLFPNFYVRWLFNEHIFEFIFGVLAATLVTKRVRFPRLMVIFGVAFIAFGWHFLYEMVGSVLTFGIGSFFIIRGSIACEMQGSECFNYSFLRHLGDASYSIYLMHYPLSVMLAKAIKKTGFHQTIPVSGREQNETAGGNKMRLGCWLPVSLESFPRSARY